MHKAHHAHFLLNKGGNSIEALKAVTGLQDAQLESFTIPTNDLLMPNAKGVADAFDRFGSHFLWFCFSIELVVDTAPG